MQLYDVNLTVASERGACLWGRFQEAQKMPNLNGLEAEYILPKVAEFQLFHIIASTMITHNCTHDLVFQYVASLEGLSFTPSNILLLWIFSE